MTCPTVCCAVSTSLHNTPNYFPHKDLLLCRVEKDGGKKQKTNKKNLQILQASTTVSRTPRYEHRCALLWLLTAALLGTWGLGTPRGPQLSQGSISVLDT